MKIIENKGLEMKIMTISMAMILLLSGLLQILPIAGAGDIPYEISDDDMGHTLQDIDQTQEIENILNNITEELMQSRIQELQDFDTRYSYALENNYAAGEYIYESFLSNGLVTEYDPFVYNGHPARNVIAELPGKTASDQIFIICGHYDSTSGIPYKLAPGADDNGSGTAGVMVAAEVLSDYEFNHTIRFIAFSMEEQWMVGSQGYVNDMILAGDNISGVINLDMIAYNPDAGTNFVNICPDFDDAGVSTDLVNFANQTAQKYEHISNIRTFDEPYGNSDHASFSPSFPAFMFIEKEWQSNPNYHLPTDTLAALNMTYCANVTQVAVAIMAELAEMRSSDNSSPVMHDIFPDDEGWGSENTTISLEIVDPSLIDPTSVKLFVNGTGVSPLLTPIPLGYNVSFINPVDFQDLDIITVNIIANDTAGNVLNSNWTFTIDGVYPSIPADINIDFVRIEMDKQGLVLDRGTAGEYDDTHVVSPSVIFHDNEYKMWYAGYDGARYRILYANSTDAVNWNKHGLVLSTGAIGSSDYYHVLDPSVIFHDNEYKMWYSGLGDTWTILYANSTDGINWVKQGISIDLGSIGDNDEISVVRSSVMYDGEYKMWYSGLGDTWTILYANSTDGINWDKLGSPVLSNNIAGDMDTFHTLYPTVAKMPDGYGMWYAGCSEDVVYRTLYANSTNGINWTRQGLAIDVGSGMGPDVEQVSRPAVLIKDGVIHIWYSGKSNENIWRILYSKLTGAEEKTDLSINWPASTSDDVQYYDLIRANDPKDLQTAGSYIHLSSNAYVDTGVGEGNSSNYYYTLKVVDKVGHVSQHTIVVGKIGVETQYGWNLLSSPFFEGEIPVDEAIGSVQWFILQYYNATGSDDQWRSNYFFPVPEALKDLKTVNNSMAIWAYTKNGFFVTAGRVSNITMELHAGWNFVSYPFHGEKQVQDALIGVPYDKVEGFNPSSAYNLEVLTDTSIMVPGQGYWVHCTSASTWQAINT